MGAREGRIIVAVAVLAAVIGVVATLVGVMRFREAESVFPVCAQLPSTAEVNAAMQLHKTDLDRVRSLEGVKDVVLAHPCKDQPDRAGIEVLVEDGAARQRVSEVWTQLPAVGAAMRIRIESGSD